MAWLTSACKIRKPLLTCWIHIPPLPPKENKQNKHSSYKTIWTRVVDRHLYTCLLLPWCLWNERSLPTRGVNIWTWFHKFQAKPSLSWVYTAIKPNTIILMLPLALPRLLYYIHVYIDIQSRAEPSQSRAQAKIQSHAQNLRSWASPSTNILNVASRRAWTWQIQAQPSSSLHNVHLSSARLHSYYQSREEPFS